MASQKRIGIDLGGTAIKGGIILDGVFLKKISLPTYGKQGREIIFQQLCKVIDQLFDDSISSIGVSTAGEVNPVEGNIIFVTDNLFGWTGFPLKQKLKERYLCDIEVENDAICALIGECGTSDTTDVTMLTFGTGVGGASIIHGKLSRSKDTAWGHAPLYAVGPLCPGCHVNHGCAEMYVSGTALTNRIVQTLHHPMDLKDFFDAYRKEEAWSIPIFCDFCRHLNALLKMIVRKIAPRKIILGGGLMQSFNLMAPLLESSLMDIIQLATYGNDAGMLGATLLPVK